MHSETVEDRSNYFVRMIFLYDIHPSITILITLLLAVEPSNNTGTACLLSSILQTDFAIPDSIGRVYIGQIPIRNSHDAGTMSFES
jgi:hypothetical protein